jgi:hypothetical protein
MSDISVTINGTKRLLTAGKYCDKDIVVKAEGGVTEVDELPVESVIGEVYKTEQSCLIDVIYVINRNKYKNTYRAMPFSEHFYYVKTKPTENIAASNEDGSVSNPYYVEDEDDVFFYINGEWTPFSTLAGMTYMGTVTNAADATEVGYYAVIGTESVYCERVNEVENVIWVRNGSVTKITELIASTSFYTIPTKTTEGILSSNGSDNAYVYYIEDEDDVFMYNGGWRSLSYNFGTAHGAITDIADATENGYYILRNEWKRYAH